MPDKTVEKVEDSNAIALEYLRNTGSVLTFNNKLYPDVELVFNSIRFIIRHEIKDQLKRKNWEELVPFMPKDFSLQKENHPTSRRAKTPYFWLRFGC